MSKRVVPVQAHACSQKFKGPAFTRKTAHLNIYSQHLAECSTDAAHTDQVGVVRLTPRIRFSRYKGLQGSFIDIPGHSKAMPYPPFKGYKGYKGKKASVKTFDC
eukprot:1140181-Pelagomonas_calceolata.AAC.1